MSRRLSTIASSIYSNYRGLKVKKSFPKNLKFCPVKFSLATEEIDFRSGFKMKSFKN